jgi:hypothetical protein
MNRGASYIAVIWYGTVEQSRDARSMSTEVFESQSIWDGYGLIPISLKIGVLFASQRDHYSGSMFAM